MKNIITYILGITFSLLMVGCSDYLDIVPEKTQELELLFERKEQAYKALATCYSYLPKYDDIYGTNVLMTDELATPVGQMTDAMRIMRGMQSVNSPYLSLWMGYNGGSYQNGLYEGINNCNILIANINSVPTGSMSEEEQEAWKSEAIFLKAYYHFLLFQSYGPIPIMDKNISIKAPVEEMRVHRSSVDECIDYIVTTIDSAMINLPEYTESTDLGRVNKIIASAIKSRVLLYAASPLFNGNSSFYGNFTGKNDELLFNPKYDKELWKRALEASDSAITIALRNNHAIYYSTEADVPKNDRGAYNGNSFFYPKSLVKNIYHYRLMFTKKWNEELLWGHSQPVTNWWQIQATALVKDTAETNEAAWQWLSPSLRMAELYYTENGLPIEADKNFDYNGRYDLTTVKRDYESHRALVGSRVPELHLYREPRFYASVCFDQGAYRARDKVTNLNMRKNGKPGGRQGSSNDYLVTGYALQKYINPSTSGKSYDNLVKYPWPLIRLGELYLNYAEAYNEYYGPDQDVYDALNQLRARVGLPDVEDVWSDANYVRPEFQNAHLDQDNLRKIIRHERMIELSFEGHRHNDLRRWKVAEDYFNTPILGWNVDEEDVEKYTELRPISDRQFISPRDYLQPIKLEEIIVNPNLVQNPDWQ